MATNIDNRTLESQFGPPSEPIDVGAFIRCAAGLPSFAQSSCQAVLNAMPVEQRSALRDACSVTDIKDALSDTWNSPKVCAHVSKIHETTVSGYYFALRPKARHRRKVEQPNAGSDTLLQTVQSNMDSVSLQCWNIPSAACYFIRGPKNTDANALSETKMANPNALFPFQGSDALLTITVYKRSSGVILRSFQHVLLSSQTLEDLFYVIPCISNELPRQVLNEDGEIFFEGQCENDGYVLCIEGQAYGDGAPGGKSYATKLSRHLKTMSSMQPQIEIAPRNAHSTRLDTLTLRLNEPYWILHQGNCEHIFVVDEIRMRHPHDHENGYPLTTHAAPILMANCRLCTKVPATLSVVGDLRLGDSPCLICGPCWRNMGSSVPSGVVVVPLPAHQAGW
ncbi:hypothetical protein FISHEDRAFT_77645 [Fistulina hepatica ATCC 64428]|uniref:snRNA-activating protein complex subunit 3 n=1 Tax=Fistulina hepatica ATCC 64428 TaxID=1128425 RepID=A0A0D7A093_9AGAR|nr:hypothetical protein FISHEDRAFT_77645 [Fistulina hepatica ATCC 64428]